MWSGVKPVCRGSWEIGLTVDPLIASISVNCKLYPSKVWALFAFN